MAGEAAGDALHVRVKLGRPGGFDLDVDLDATPGVTVLFGPSGAGKSTTLAAVAGFVRPASGRVALGRTAWFDADAGVDLAVHLRGVAFVFQSLALFPHMTAADNVAYGMPRRLALAERRGRADALLARFRVAHLGDRRPRTFSGGEAQRVALARALAPDPRVVLLDEPFSALDGELRAELMGEVREHLRERGVPALFVTHDPGEARALGDRLVVLDRGRVARVGTVDELGD